MVYEESKINQPNEEGLECAGCGKKMDKPFYTSIITDLEHIGRIAKMTKEEEDKYIEEHTKDGILTVNLEDENSPAFLCQMIQLCKTCYLKLKIKKRI